MQVPKVPSDWYLAVFRTTLSFASSQRKLSWWLLPTNRDAQVTGGIGCAPNMHICSHRRHSRTPQPRHPGKRFALIRDPYSLNPQHHPMTTRTKSALVAGARPNFMKVAPIIRELRKHEGSLRLEPGSHRPALRSRHERCFLSGTRHPRAELSHGCRRRITCRANCPHHGGIREVL